jgi:hypothetical protein
LDALGTIDHVGPSVADGYTAKLLANLLWFGQAVAVTEALLLGQSLGLAPARLAATLRASAGGSVFIDEYLDALLDGDYLETFSIARAVEELDTLASLAQQEGVPFELSATVVRLHREALERFGAQFSGQTMRLVVAGGVAANRHIAERLEALCSTVGAELIVPPIALCTDNGAMVAWAGAERFMLGVRYGLDVTARPRWPLDLADMKVVPDAA